MTSREQETLLTVHGYVDRYNERCGGTLRLQVPDADVRQDGAWFYVLVEPADASARAYDYYDILAQLEDDIQQNEGVRVMLVPVMPG